MNEEQIIAEVREAFFGYEKALVTNDVEALISYFWNDPRAVRLTADGGHYGFDDIAAFRRARDVRDVPRNIDRVEFLLLAPDVVVANCEYTRDGSGRRGGQSHVWKKCPEGWKIASAHVSLGPEPTPKN